MCLFLYIQVFFCVRHIPTDLHLCFIRIHIPLSTIHLPWIFRHHMIPTPGILVITSQPPCSIFKHPLSRTLNRGPWLPVPSGASFCISLKRLRFKIMYQGSSIFKAGVFSSEKVHYWNLFLDVKSEFIESILRNQTFQYDFMLEPFVWVFVSWALNYYWKAWVL